MQEHAVRQDQERLRPLSKDRGEGAVEVFRCPHVQQLQLYSQCLGSGVPLLHGHGVKRIGRIDEHGDVRDFGNNLAEKLQPLALEVRCDRA